MAKVTGKVREFCQSRKVGTPTVGLHCNTPVDVVLHQMRCTRRSKLETVTAFITVRNSSSGKVMFSQASVILSTGGGRA